MGYWNPDEPDRVCECGHDLEYCHDFDENDKEGGECGVYGCPCKKFKEVKPKP